MLPAVGRAMRHVLRAASAIPRASSVVSGRPNLGQQQRGIGLVPMVLESTPRGERAFDIFSRLLQERIVMLNGTIHDVRCNQSN